MVLSWVDAGVDVVVRSAPHLGSVDPHAGRERRDIDVMSPTVLRSYLHRIGLSAEVLDSAGERVLRQVAGAQFARIPFEIFDIHRGIPLDVAVAAIEDKLLDRGRGGVCYELNGLLARALRTLGFEAELVGAAVNTPDGPGLPLAHVAILVGFGADRWLVDVGFGGDMIVHPIGSDSAAGWDVHFPSGSSYRTEGVTRPLADFAGMAWWHSTSPRSRCTSGIVCTLTDNGVRKTLSCKGDEQYRLVTADGAQRSARDLSDDEALDVLVREFGIVLAELPRPGRF